MCSLVPYTVQFNLSLHVYFINDIIVLKCVKTHVSRIPRDNLLKKIIPEKTKRIHTRDDAYYKRDLREDIDSTVKFDYYSTG